MASLIGKALARAPSGRTPVPMGSDTVSRLPGTAPYSASDLTLLRAFKQNGTVNSNVSLLASSVAAPAWKLFRVPQADGRVRYTTSDKGSDQRTEVVQHAALNLLNNPAPIVVNGVQLPAWTRFGLMELSGIWLETTGKSFWVVDWGAGNSSPVPLGLWPVRPDRVRPVPSRDSFLAGYVYTAPGGTEQIPLLPTDVIYCRYPDPEDLYGGAGPIGSVLTDVEAAGYAAQWNRNYFVNSAEPGGVIQVDHEMDDDEFNALSNRWREAHRGVARAHRVAVLEGGQTWVPNAHSMRDMDFAGLRMVSRDIIREALGMHKVMTGVTDDVNRANAQTGEEVFASWKVSPRLDRWKDVFNSQLLPLFGATGQGVEWDYVYPTPQNREQDALELTSKSNAVLALVTAGYDQHDVLKMVGLPDMKVALTLTSEPALPPRWTLGSPSGPSPAGAPAEEGAAGPAARMPRQFTAWEALSALERQTAAWNALAGAP